jgi:hypothetical protein
LDRGKDQQLKQLIEAMQTWLNYFQHNRTHRATIPWDLGIKIEPHLREPLIRSLKKFQLGESGDGLHLKQHTAVKNDPIYAGAIDLFIKEEQEHSRLMGEIVQHLNAPLLKSHWSDNCFILMRHFFALNQELMVLLLPEMIAKRYFKALHGGTKDEVLRAVFAQIAHDEEGHLAFHVEYLRRQFAGMTFIDRIAAQVIWRFLFRATCVAVLLDHRTVLAAVGESPRDFWRGCGEIFDEVAAGIFSPAQVLAPVKLLEVSSL